MILLWGVPGDRPLSLVHRALVGMGHPPRVLSQHDVADTEVEVSVGCHVEGRIRMSDGDVNLADVTALYVRPYDTRQIPAVARAGPDSDVWHHAIQVDDALLSWAELTAALVVNRPSAMASNGSKPYQSAWIERFGFLVPDTLMTTEPDLVRKFRQDHGTVVYKSMSGVRSVVARLTDSHNDRLEDVAWCPTQFQEYVPGEDYRVHVVGREVFACRIASPADDYRYAARNGNGIAIDSCVVPPEVAERCLAISVDMGLLVSGVDLRRRDDGRWYCFEVNPSPGFSYFESETGQPIAEAVARLLLSV